MYIVCRQHLLRRLYLSLVDSFQERMVERIRSRYPLCRVKGQHLVQKVKWYVRDHAAEIYNVMEGQKVNFHKPHPTTWDVSAQC